MDYKDIHRFQVERQIINLYKSFLVLVEDLKDDHDMHFGKLRSTFFKQRSLIDQANYLDDDKLHYLRKKILDAGNDCIRAIDDLYNKE